MKHLFIHALIVFLLLCSVAVAWAEVIDVYDENMALGMEYLGADKNSDAAASFRTALKDRPDDHRAALHLGIALMRSGDKEAEGALKRALLLDPSDPETNLQLGIYYLEKDIYDEARDFFEAAQESGKGTETGRSAERYIRVLDAGEKEKRWSLSLSLGAQYDSNVILNNEDTPLPEGISDEADYRGIINLGGSYTLVKTDTTNAAIGYSLYQSLHGDLTDFNVMAHSISLGASRDIRENIRLKGVYSFDYTFVGSEAFNQTHNIAPSVLIAEGQGFVTALDYRLSLNTFEDSDSFPDNSDRTGNTNNIGISQVIPLGKLKSKLGYSFETATADIADYEYTGHEGFLNLTFGLPQKITSDIHTEGQKKQYDDSADREDTTYMLSLSLKRPLTSSTGLNLSVLYMNNDSSVDAYSYTRTVTGLFFSVVF
jgi:Tfp pilus assembly protein PilF